eukprot:TRINITY_DN9838_c0_g1_i3.p1 TRINITY_DN9838_c0_g1~~TRINITY_DN9838_c0_g1_i3.p1  ORF type:complete len:379 (-),score=67.31 TRINITY_DN9838_c0_g1_i3:46-1182(-)
MAVADAADAASLPCSSAREGGTASRSPNGGGYAAPGDQAASQQPVPDGSTAAASQPTKKAVLPLLRRLLTEVNRRVVQPREELISYEELADFAYATTPSPEDAAKIVQIRQQLTTALHQFFRSRWPSKKADWSAEERARGLDRPTGNRALGNHAVDLRAMGVPYINAALVPGLKPGLSYLATQHPLPQTVGHFWRMVLHMQPAAIVMLNGHAPAEEVEDGFAEAPYWEPSALPADGLSLAVEEVRHEKAADCTVRQLCCRLGDIEWRGPQLVVSWWRDQSEPPLECFLELDRLFNSFLGASGSDCVFVHCAGGIGRAGVFIAADAGARAAQDEARASQCSPDRLIGHLRECRMNMVQTAEQYEFLHRALPLLTEQMRA